ncbi:MAG: AMP-binding protein, partial [Clostridiales bacterium]|nr:AMP-binding protein [Clostridiales bacterium]
MNLLDRFLSRTAFDSMTDFRENYRIRVPERFNFAFDVADEMARLAPDQRALVWANPEGEERVFTFGQIKYWSDKTANYLKGLGVRKGDAVMVILKRHYEFWFAILALHKLGAVTVPATHLLTRKDIIYRNNAAGISMIICTGDGTVSQSVSDSLGESPTVREIVYVGEDTPSGWRDFRAGVEAADPHFERPTGAEACENSDPSLMYFTSGTAAMPKMVLHSMTYPLGHIATAKYWQNCADGGLHLTVADTGWGKAVWGKI